MDIGSKPKKKPIPGGGRVVQTFTVQGARTTMRLEAEFQDAMNDVCRREGIGVVELIEQAERRTRHASRTSAVRIYLLGYFRDRISEAG